MTALLGTIALLLAAVLLVIMGILMNRKNKHEQINLAMRLIPFLQEGGVDESVAEQLVVSMTGLSQGSARVLVATAYKIRREQAE